MNPKLQEIEEKEWLPIGRFRRIQKLNRHIKKSQYFNWICAIDEAIQEERQDKNLMEAIIQNLNKLLTLYGDKPSENQIKTFVEAEQKRHKLCNCGKPGKEVKFSDKTVMYVCLDCMAAAVERTAQWAGKNSLEIKGPHSFIDELEGVEKSA